MTNGTKKVSAMLPTDAIVHYQDLDFIVLTPDEVTRDTQEVIFDWAGVKIARISSEIVVKYGVRVAKAEAMNMRFVASATKSIPVPRTFAAYTCRPRVIDRDDPDALETYIFMEHITGITLDKAWSIYDQDTKTAICQQLSGYLEELRSLSPASYVGSLDNGPVLDNILGNTNYQGPFSSVASFHHTIATEYQKVHKGKIAPYIESMLNANKYRITFAHADLRQANIVLHDGKIAGILDWEMAGWYPEYWDFVKMFYIYHFHDDWGQHVLASVRVYTAEAAIHSYVSSLLW